MNIREIKVFLLHLTSSEAGKNKLAKSYFNPSGLQIIFETLRGQMSTSDELELTPGFDPEFPRKNHDLSSLGY